MKYKKHILSFIIIIIFSVSTVYAQETPEKKEIVVEIGCTWTVDPIIFIEMAKGNSKEQKYITLEFIEHDIEILYNDAHYMYAAYEALKYLAFEGTVNTTIPEGYPINDFPHLPIIRRKAVKLLGQLGTIEAKTALLEVLKYEDDILVRHEAIRALFLNKSDIQKNEDGTNVLFNAIIENRQNKTDK
jgi:hypothetical protein